MKVFLKLHLSYYIQNLHWKLGQQTPSAGTFLAYLQFHEILFSKDADFFSGSLKMGQESSNRWRFAVPIFWEGFDHNPIINDFCIKRKRKNVLAFLQDKKMHVICNFINALGQLIPRLVQTTCPEKKQIFIKFFGQMSYSFFFCTTSSQNQYSHTVKSRVLTCLV